MVDFLIYTSRRKNQTQSHIHHVISFSSNIEANGRRITRCVY